MPKPTQEEQDSCWAMSENELARSGFKFVGWLLCGDTFTGNTFSSFQYPYSVANALINRPMVYHNQYSPQLRSTQNIQFNPYQGQQFENFGSSIFDQNQMY